MQRNAMQINKINLFTALVHGPHNYILGFIWGLLYITHATGSLNLLLLIAFFLYILLLCVILLGRGTP